MPILRPTVAALAIILLVATATSSRAQLERTYQAHGGLPVWQSYRMVDFDLDWKSAKRANAERHTFDLKTRDGLIKAENYTIGADKGQVWITPSIEALGGSPPRFYMWTPFYFFAMPFVFADPGANLEPLGTRNVAGVDYDVVKVTFKAGTGDSPEDYYLVHLEKESGQLKVVAYIVTYPALRKSKPLSELEPHGIMFDEWQAANDLSVPKSARLFNWKNDNLEGEPIGFMQFTGVRFLAEAPQADRFQKPEGAVIAPLE